MSYIFSSESVSEGHPDKLADQISDAILDHFMAFDQDAKVACETLLTTGQVVLAGEIKSKTYIEVQKVVRETIRKVGYTKSNYHFDAASCGIFSALHEQSSDIARGVEKEKQGAGDQGIIFGYATRETQEYMPAPIMLSHKILQALSDIRKEGKAMPYLGPDAKTQISIQYSDVGIPEKIDSIVLSTQHDDFASEEQMHQQISKDIKKILMPRVLDAYCDERLRTLFHQDICYYINPTERFVIGGPHGDAGLTGRKIIVDTYGGSAPHGGGALSGKDPSKVDRSAAYATRYIAKNMVHQGLCDKVLIQIAYVIGIDQPVAIYVNSFGTAKNGLTDNDLQKIITKIDLTPSGIIKCLKLCNPIYEPTATYGHFGRTPQIVERSFENDGKIEKIKVNLFSWENLNLDIPL